MATGKIELRSSYPEPSHPEALSLSAELHPILLRHPGYPDDRNMLLSFLSIDNDGIHHETARLACAIVAGNRWDGFFCEDKEGQRRVTAGPDESLRGLTYYFHLPDVLNQSYAITPTFYHWVFPHHNLPKYWKVINSSSLATTSPTEQPRLPCRMTLNKQFVENAHLVPAAQEPWFDKNHMAIYTRPGGVDSMKDKKNIIQLRSDVHKIFDAKLFAIVPKEGVLVAHTFIEAESEVLQLYHNVKLHRIEVSVSLLFARFAYTIFECLRTSLKLRRPLKLRLRLEAGMAEKECTSSECAKFATETAMQSKSSSGSPKKRQRPLGVNDTDEEEPEATDEEEPEATDEEEPEATDEEEPESTDEEEHRGRKRWRKGESWTFSDSFVNKHCSEDESVESANMRPLVV